MDQREIEFLKYRWEFMRRNPSYREDYKKVAKLRKKAGKLHSSKKV